MENLSAYSAEEEEEDCFVAIMFGFFLVIIYSSIGLGEKKGIGTVS